MTYFREKMPAEIRIAKQKYRFQRARAQQRGIQMKMTFEQWYQWWQDTGHWSQRGKGGYVMSRINDTGDYELGNVFCQLDGENSAEAARKKKGIPKPENGKPTHTPDGIFPTRKAAAKHYRVDVTTMGTWIKNNKTGFYFI